MADNSDIDPQQDMTIDPQTDTRKLGLWMRLIANSHIIEKEVRALFRSEFGVTLPRFDLMSALYREPSGLTMGALSRKLLVSNGNITGIVERLQKEDLVKRWILPTDHRVYSVGLTLKGRHNFKKMARRHQDWIETILEELDGESLDEMIQMMDCLRKILRTRRDKEQEG